MHADTHGPAAVHERVIEEIGHHVAQVVRVPLDPNGLRRVDLELSPRFFGKRQDERRRFTDHARQIEPPDVGHSIGPGGVFLTREIS